MKLYKVINASQFIVSLSDNDKLSYDTLWNLFQLQKTIQPHIEFFEEQVNKLKEKFRPQADENGNITGKALVEYSTQVNELGELEVELKDFEKCTIKLKDSPGLTLKAMIALEDFINFEKE